MVSGTRVGMTAAQKDAFADVLHKHAAVQQLLHGVRGRGGVPPDGVARGVNACDA